MRSMKRLSFKELRDSQCSPNGWMGDWRVVCVDTSAHVFLERGWRYYVRWWQYVRWPILRRGDEAGRPLYCVGFGYCLFLSLRERPRLYRFR